jgi:hypothetical protein
MNIKRYHLWAIVDGKLKAIVTGKTLADMARRFWHKRMAHKLKDEHPLLVQVEREDGRRSRNLEGIRRAEILSMNLGGYRGWAGQFEWDFPPRYRVNFPSLGIAHLIPRKKVLPFLRGEEVIYIDWTNGDIPVESIIEIELPSGWKTLKPLTDKDAQ